MENNRDTTVIDLRHIIKKLTRKKTAIIGVMIGVFVLSSFLIIGVPRYYITDTKLAPEIEASSNNGTLGSIASSLGIDIAQMQSSDAITPLLYPSLMEDNKFITDLFFIPIKSLDGRIKMNYYEYLTTNQKKPWWKNIIKPSLSKDTIKNIKPYLLTKTQNKIAERIRDDIKLSVDSKNGVITISVKSQDPLVCKMIADAVRAKLQNFITNYRTNKAQRDLDYYKKLSSEAKQVYEKSRKLYGSYADANTDIVLQSFRSKINDLENDMQLKYNTYTSLNTQYETAKAKLQERTPAFTVLKGAVVPNKPAGPKRIIFVLSMMFLAFCLQSIWILRKDILKIFK